ncbi:chitobiase/beta-hexosaminidase C-terminal domain-containing protein, partial [Streptococcus uberis]
NNTSIFPHCSTFYQCGMTILHAPRGTISRVYLVDRINPITGLEDRLARTDWCNRVDAEQVAFHKLEEETSCYPQTLPLLGINERAFPQGLRQMGRGADRINGRAGHAQWALHRGRIYVSPWIQSGEAVVVEWDGIQTDWLNSHLVESDPLLARAIRYFVIAQDARDFGADPITSDRAEQAFQEARRELMYNCHQQTRVRGIEPSNARRSISLSEMAGLGGGETLLPDGSGATVGNGGGGGVDGGGVDGGGNPLTTTTPPPDCSNLTCCPKVIAPVTYDPPSGSCVNFPIRVVLRTATPCAEIYYTLDGTTPTAPCTTSTSTS